MVHLVSSLQRRPTPETKITGVKEDESGILTSGIAYKAGVRIFFTERTPHDLDETAGGIVIAPGLYGLKRTYGDFRDAVAARTRRRVTTYRHARRETSLRDAIHPDKLLHPAKIGAQSVACMIDLAYERGEGVKASVAGHSKGGPDATDGVLYKASKVDKLVLIGSGGLEADQNIFRLGLRLPGVAVNEVAPFVANSLSLANAKLASHAMMHALGNPWRLFGEVLDIANRPMMELELEALGELGIGRYAVFFDEDGFFPLEHAPTDSPLLDGYTVMRGFNHLAPQDYPIETADAVASQLDTKPALYIVGSSTG